jgi:adenylate cyclase class IV
MARNVEIKARVADLAALTATVARLADSGPLEILQDDTFFNCDRGRLKLRAFSPQSGELIFYQRPDAAGPKQ